MYGVDANGDGVKDPYNPVDAVFAAARYLKAAGADQDIRRAVFAYNHADWYVDSVMLRAQVIGGLPSNLVGSLTGLTQGRFPVQARATYAGQLKARAKKVREGNAAMLVESTGRRGIKIFSRERAPAVAVNDGRIVAIGTTKRLGRYVKLQDVYGNTYTYGNLDSVAKRFPAPKAQDITAPDSEPEQQPTKDAAPSQPASDSTAPAAKEPARKLADKATPEGRKAPHSPASTEKQRLFANPARPNASAAGGAQQVFEQTGMIDGVETFKGYYERVLGLSRDEVQLKRLRPGARVVAGTILGRLGKQDARAAYLQFEIRPAGRGAPRVDPKPILDGWKLLESTAIYRANGKNPFFGADAANPSIGQILLMSKEALIQRVLTNPQIDIYACGRQDVRAGQIDRRVLATLEFLAASGLRPTVTAAQVRPLVPDDVRQRVRALDRHGRRHRRDQRHHDHAVDPGQGLDHRDDHPAPAHAAGHDEAAPDHLAHAVRRDGQHVRDGRSRRSHPRRLPAVLRGQLEGRPPGERDPQAQAVDQADRPAGRDR